MNTRKLLTITKFALLTLLALSVMAAAACGNGNDDDDESQEEEINPFGLETTVVASVEFPTAFAFAPDGRMFFAEQYTGRIRVLTPDDELVPEPFADIEVAEWLGLDWGVTGMALDPNFGENGFVYVFYTAPVDSDPNQPIGQPVLVRFRDDNGRGTDETVITDDFPESREGHQGFKNNGRIAFGPDGYLYVSLGDYDYATDGPGDVPAAQDLSVPIGKLLRIDAGNGEAAPGNPFEGQEDADPRIWAYGFAQPAPFAFHPDTGQLYMTDNTIGCEELNLIAPGANYGWPEVGDFPFADCTAGPHTQGIHFMARRGMNPGDFLSYIETSGMAFLSGNVYQQIGEGLLICSEETGEMRRLAFAGDSEVTSDDPVIGRCRGDVAISPEGIIYFGDGETIRRLEPNGQAPPDEALGEDQAPAEEPAGEEAPGDEAPPDEPEGGEAPLEE